MSVFVLSELSIERDVPCIGFGGKTCGLSGVYPTVASRVVPFEVRVDPINSKVTIIVLEPVQSGGCRHSWYQSRKCIGG
jgi:hypothetical protein